MRCVAHKSWVTAVEDGPTVLTLDVLQSLRNVGDLSVFLDVAHLLGREILTMDFHCGMKFFINNSAADGYGGYGDELNE